VCAKAAIKTIADKGKTLPLGVRFHCIAVAEAQHRAYGRDPAWNAICYVTLGSTTTIASSVDRISNQNTPGFTKDHVTYIHEIGHLLHMQAMGEDFCAKRDSGGLGIDPPQEHLGGERLRQRQQERIRGRDLCRHDDRSHLLRRGHGGMPFLQRPAIRRADIEVCAFTGRGRIARRSGDSDRLHRAAQTTYPSIRVKVTPLH